MKKIRQSLKNIIDNPRKQDLYQLFYKNILNSVELRELYKKKIISARQATHQHFPESHQDGSDGLQQSSVEDKEF